MAALSDADRAECHAEFMRQNAATIAVNKPDLRAAINAIDDWAVSNASSFNNALPTAAKTNLTAAQKARLLAFVVLARYEKGA